MKGQAPVLMMRFYPQDYVNDHFVRACYHRRDYRTAAFYAAFLFYSHIEGGTLPVSVSELSAITLMPARDVQVALRICMAAKKIRKAKGRLYQKRVLRDVQRALQYRAAQAEIGAQGGRPKKDETERVPKREALTSRKGSGKGSLFGPKSQTKTKPKTEPKPKPLPFPKTPNHLPHGDGALRAQEITGPKGTPPAPPALRRWIPYDPKDQLQQRVAQRCWQLAVRDARAEGRHGVAAEDVQRVLHSISSTKDGTHLDALTKASPEWLAQTLSAADKFEADMDDGGTGDKSND